MASVTRFVLGMNLTVSGSSSRNGIEGTTSLDEWDKGSNNERAGWMRQGDRRGGGDALVAVQYDLGISEDGDISWPVMRASR